MHPTNHKTRKNKIKLSKNQQQKFKSGQKMNITLRNKTIQKTITNARNFYFRKIKKGCECPDPPPDKIVEEKSCRPCSFKTWKPKPRKLLEQKLKEIKKPDPPRKCFAGMMKKPPPDCSPADINPHLKKCCTGPKPPILKPPPKPIVEEKLPEGDWEAKC